MCKSVLATAGFSTISFVLGAVTSMVYGFLWMKIATYVNARTTLEARTGGGKAFIIAFRYGAVMGFLLAANGLLVLYININVFKQYYGDNWEGLFEFDDPRNPVVIADNVGDIAGMGFDIFSSYAESYCAALVVASISSFGINHESTPMLYPRIVSSVESCQELATLLVCCCWSLADLITGFVTEYFTNNAHSLVQDVADSCQTGAAINVIFGLALRYKSVIIPIFAIIVNIFVSFSFATMYGIAVTPLGISSTIATRLVIDAYGPISDNAGRIAEMADMIHRIRDRIDALDTAGNTNAAIEKGLLSGPPWCII
ncbi:hypothetical protein Peur_001235 [Populus x canadensis]